MKRFRRPMIGIGLVLLVVAAAWRPLAVPQLVRFPGHLDTTLHYQGTFRLYVNEATGAALTPPDDVPLTVDRHLVSVSGQQSSSRAVIHETLTLHLGQRVQVQENQYVFDRRSMQNLRDDRSWSLKPSNVVDRSGTYYLQMPMSFHFDSVHQTWQNQTASSYPMGSAGPSHRVDGVTVRTVSGQMAARPVSAATATDLTAQGTPTALSGDRLNAQLRAAGIDPTAAMATLAGALSADEMTKVGTLLAQPVPLHYLWATEGAADIEGRSGAVLRLPSVNESLLVQPDTSSLTTVLPVLQGHADSPGMGDLITKLTAMSQAAPQPVYQLLYAETPQSYAQTASTVRSNLRQMTLVETVLPVAIAVIAMVLLAVALVRRRPPEPSSVAEPLPVYEAQGHRDAA